MDFTNQLKAIRKSVKMTQIELAERLGVKQASVSGWECGDVSPTLDKFVKVCEIFSVTPNVLLGFGDEPFEKTFPEPEMIGPYICYSDNEKEPLTADEEKYLMQCLIRGRRGQANSAELNKYSAAREINAETA